MRRKVFLITILLACISLLIFNINVEAANTTLICNIKAEKTEMALKARGFQLHDVKKTQDKS